MRSIALGALLLSSCLPGVVLEKNAPPEDKLATVADLEASVIPEGNAVSLSWVNPAAPGFAGVQIERRAPDCLSDASPAAAPVIITDSAVHELVDDGLVDGGEYCWAVFAAYGADLSAAAVVRATPADSVAPAAVESLAATANSDGSVDLAFTQAEGDLTWVRVDVTTGAAVEVLDEEHLADCVAIPDGAGGCRLASVPAAETFVSVFLVDPEGNTSGAAHVTVVDHQAPSPLVDQNVHAYALADGAVRIEWGGLPPGPPPESGLQLLVGAISAPLLKVDAATAPNPVVLDDVARDTEVSLQVALVDRFDNVSAAVTRVVHTPFGPFEHGFARDGFDDDVVAVSATPSGVAVLSKVGAGLRLTGLDPLGATVWTADVTGAGGALVKPAGLTDGELWLGFTAVDDATYAVGADGTAAAGSGDADAVLTLLQIDDATGAVLDHLAVGPVSPDAPAAIARSSTLPPLIGAAFVSADGAPPPPIVVARGATTLGSTDLHAAVTQGLGVVAVDPVAGSIAWSAAGPASASAPPLFAGGVGGGYIVGSNAGGDAAPFIAGDGAQHDVLGRPWFAQLSSTNGQAAFTTFVPTVALLAVARGLGPTSFVAVSVQGSPGQPAPFNGLADPYIQVTPVDSVVLRFNNTTAQQAIGGTEIGGGLVDTPFGSHLEVRALASSPTGGVVVCGSAFGGVLFGGVASPGQGATVERPFVAAIAPEPTATFHVVSAMLDVGDVNGRVNACSAVGTGAVFGGHAAGLALGASSVNGAFAARVDAPQP